MRSTLLKSFWMGGFECTCHYNGARQRLDLLAGTRHDRLARADYLALQQSNIFTVRDGLRWHLIEAQSGHYDFSSALPMVRAACETGTQVIWDLCHFGWPGDIDIFRPEFVKRFARYAQAVAHILTQETDEPPLIAPINEISFLSWSGGEEGHVNPFQEKRGLELKLQLVRATIEAIEFMWDVNPRIRIAAIDPVFYTRHHPDRPEERAAAEDYRTAQYHAWDMLAGWAWPQLGGDPKYLDLIGVNYYPYNQWFHGGPEIRVGDPAYRPFRDILQEVYQRYQRPLFIGETGAEGHMRVPWLRYMGQEIRAALNAGIPLEGVCLYPITDYPGWDNNRHCPTGLLGYANEQGQREVYQPLADELQTQQQLLEELE